MRQTKQLVICALCTAFLAVSAFIRIPLPVIPVTLQLQAVCLVACLFGAKTGVTSATLYLALGLLGLPIFAQGGGIAYVLRPSFGYLLGFLPAAFVTGICVKKTATPSFGNLYAASLAGVFTAYLFGFPYLYFITRFYLHSDSGLWALLYQGVLLTLPADILLAAGSALAAVRFIPIKKA